MAELTEMMETEDSGPTRAGGGKHLRLCLESTERTEEEGEKQSEAQAVSSPRPSKAYQSWRKLRKGLRRALNKPARKTKKEEEKEKEKRNERQVVRRAHPSKAFQSWRKLQKGLRHTLRKPAKKTKKEKRKQNEAQDVSGPQPSKAYQSWRKLQKGLRQAMDKMKKEELKAIHLSHGLQHLSRAFLGNPVRYVTHDSREERFVVLDSENRLHSLKEDGTYKGWAKAPAPMVGILYASEVDRFVAWDEGGLQVLDSSFQLLSQVCSALPIRCGLYSEYLNRVVTAGEGNFTLWSFRYGARSLQCRIVVSEGLAPGDIFTRLVLDPNSFQPQRCFASCMTGAAALDISSGKLLSFKKELHSRAITDITYCEVIGCAITASRDTTIKVWDKNWHIQTVFVGHTGPVVAVTMYPQRPLIFSASQDGTIRTWNLNTIDQVDQVHFSEPVDSLKTVTLSHVVSVSGSSLTLWKINKLYSLYTPVGCPIRRISCVNLEALGNFPVRAVCICEDSTVRMVDVQSGVITGILFLDSPQQGLDVAYCLPRETLFVLMENGAVLRANSTLDPMLVRKSLPGSTWASPPSCLLVYSHVLDPEKVYSQWLDVVDCKGYKKQWQRLPDKNRCLLILGHKTGFLTVVEWFLTRDQYKVEAHGSKAVTALTEYPTQMCIISAGADRTVKMWRVFPYTTECLVPLLSFSCASPALHMCSLKETLAVAFQDPETVTYSIVYYNLMEQTRFEHGPEEDAQADITGLCCCPNLKLFASSSRDGSVKIWDMENKMLRHLKMNTIPECLAFANHWGDLLVGLERHLYLIHHNKYLPSHYRMKLLCAKFLEPLKDIPLPISDSCFEALVKENARRLKEDPPLEEIDSPVPGARRMALQESKVLRDIHAKAEGLSQVANRDQDLEELLKGKATVTKTFRVTKEMKDEAFGKYLQIFYKPQPKVEIPKEDTFNAEEVLEIMGRAKSISELYGPDGMFLGAFPQPISLQDPKALEDTSPPPEGSPLAVPSTITTTSVSEIKETLLSPPSPVRLLLSGVRRSRSEQIGMAQKGRRPSIDKKRVRRPVPPPASPPVLTSPTEVLEPSSSPPSDEVEKSPPGMRPALQGVMLSGIDTRDGKVKTRRAKLDKDAVNEAETGVSLSPPSQPSSTPSFSGEPIRSEKSVVFKDSPSPAKSPGSPSSPAKSRESSPSLAAKSQESSPSLAAKSQESSPSLPAKSRELSPFSPVRSQASSSKSPGSISRIRSQASSVIIKGFFPERPPSSSKDHFRLQVQEQESQHMPLPRLSSGFIPNSVAALQFHSKEMLMEDREERLMKVVEPETESSSRMVPTWKVEEAERPRRKVSRESSVTKPSSKQSMPAIFMTQLDESQYPEPKKEPPFFVWAFLDMLWFQDLFPEGFPPEMTLNEFLMKMMASLVASRDFSRKADLVAAIASLKDDMGNWLKELACSTFVQLLNKKDDLPSLRERRQRRFILGTLRALVRMDKDNKDLMVELMAFYMQASTQDKMILQELMQEAGVQDPHSFFTKELSSWPVKESDSKETLRGTCNQWLGEKMQELKEQRVKLLAQKVPPERGYSYKPFQKRRSTTVGLEVQAKSKMSSPESHEELSSSSVDPEEQYSPESYKEVGKELGEKEQPERKAIVEKRMQSPQEQVGSDVTDHEGQPERKESGSMESEMAQFWMQPVRPVDAIHYFTEKQLEKELEEMKELISSSLISPKDTVMALPPIKKKRAILRLGETNAMLRKRMPERFYFPYAFPRYLMKGFAPFVKLPLPRINLEPFPPLPERPAPPQSFTTRQQLVQKYYIPRFSYADSYP